MKLTVLKLREALGDSFWFLPAVMAVGATGAALGSVAVDQAIGSDWVEDINWVWSGGADGARAVLSVVAGSIMTVVSIVFSLTLTTLAQTSSHFGPRVLRTFTSDRYVQLTLGTFIGTFVYCLLVLRTVRSQDENGFVPYLSVNLGVLLTLLALAVLIGFIHHLSQTIQGENLVAAVGRELERSLDVLFPERLGEPAPDEEAAAAGEPAPWGGAACVGARETGYLQNVDQDALLRVAIERDLVLALERRPGEFVVAGAPLLRARPPARIDGELADHLRGCFGTGRHRTPQQDALYLAQQLVEIALRALSPGVNEPYTAQTCVDWISAWLRGLVGRKLPSAARRDGDGRLRVIARAIDLDLVAREVLTPLRRHAATNAALLAQLASVIADLAPELRRDGDRRALDREARLIADDARRLPGEDERAWVLAACDRARRELVRAR